MKWSVVMPIITAVLGFVGGLLLPRVQWSVERRRLEREEQAKAIRDWRKSINEFDFENEEYRNTVWYSSLRIHMKPEVIERLERPRTVFVSGPRGDPAQKYMLLDEVSRLEGIHWGVPTTES